MKSIGWSDQHQFIHLTPAAKPAQTLTAVLLQHMQAANLFERTVKGIARCVVAAPAAEARLMAQKALLALLESLDAWAGPLKVGAAAPGLCCNSSRTHSWLQTSQRAAMPAALSCLVLRNQDRTDLAAFSLVCC